MMSDLDHCRRTLRGGSLSFHAASLVLPRRIREPAAALYAFCRSADDVIDCTANPAAALLELQDRVDRIYRGDPSPLAADRAFATVVRTFAIPRALPDALLEGFAWDVDKRGYRTLDDLSGYAARVAGSVGAMMTLLMDRREPHLVARATDLGVAMQLTNIARDVGEDARNGRLYLPQDWLRDAGIDPDAFLARPQFTPALGEVVRRLLAAADALYARSCAGIAGLPARCRPSIHAARLLYREIGCEVERRGLDSVSQRAVVSPRRKLRTLAALVPALVARTEDASPAPLNETQFLVDAVQACPAPGREEFDAIPWWNLRDRAINLLLIIERLERQDQLKRINP